MTQRQGLCSHNKRNKHTTVLRSCGWLISLSQVLSWPLSLSHLRPSHNFLPPSSASSSVPSPTNFLTLVEPVHSSVIFFLLSLHVSEHVWHLSSYSMLPSHCLHTNGNYIPLQLSNIPLCICAAHFPYLILRFIVCLYSF